MALRTRLTLWYTGVLAITLLVFGVALYYFISHTTQFNIESELRMQGEKFVGEIIVVPRWNIVQLPEPDDFRTAGTFLQANRIDGKITKSNFPGSLPFNKSDFKRAQTEKSWFTSYMIEDSELLVYHISMESSGEFLGVLQVATVVSDDFVFLQILRNFLLLLSIVTVLIAATLGYYLARKALKPIEGIIVAANRIGSGEDLAQRIKHTGPSDEIGHLTSTINSMLSRVESTYKELEDAYRTQRRFVADASHELRTPLTTIRGNVELLEKMWRSGRVDENMTLSFEAMRDISEEASRMSRLVGDLLALARADAGQQINKRALNMKAVLEEVVRKVEFLPRKAEWRIGDLSAVDQAVIIGNADYLQQLFYIIIENAFKYTNEGYVRIDALRLENQLGIRVQDTGIGLDADEVPQIFERFYRADASRGVTAGTGLGLSIARWIIDEHDGSIEVVTKKGEGSMFLLWFPIVADTSNQEDML
jgi:two-component system OmpR family sensor kinase